MNKGDSHGILVTSVRALNVENCFIAVFASGFGVERLNAGTFETRVNKAVTGKGLEATSGGIGPFLPM